MSDQARADMFRLPADDVQDFAGPSIHTLTLLMVRPAGSRPSSLPSSVIELDFIDADHADPVGH